MPSRGRPGPAPQWVEPPPRAGAAAAGPGPGPGSGRGSASAAGVGGAGAWSGGGTGRGAGGGGVGRPRGSCGAEVFGREGRRCGAAVGPGLWPPVPPLRPLFLLFSLFFSPSFSPVLGDDALGLGAGRDADVAAGSGKQELWQKLAWEVEENREMGEFLDPRVGRGCSPRSLTGVQRLERLQPRRRLPPPRFSAGEGCVCVLAAFSCLSKSLFLFQQLREASDRRQEQLTLGRRYRCRLLDG